MHNRTVDGHYKDSELYLYRFDSTIGRREFYQTIAPIKAQLLYCCKIRFPRTFNSRRNIYSKNRQGFWKIDIGKSRNRILKINHWVLLFIATVGWPMFQNMEVLFFMKKAWRVVLSTPRPLLLRAFLEVSAEWGYRTKTILFLFPRKIVIFVWFETSMAVLRFVLRLCQLEK